MASPSARANEAPHATVAPQISTADTTVQDFAALSGAAGVATKPDKAFTGNYGPLTGGVWGNTNLRVGVTATVEEMSKEFYGWTDQQKQDFRNKLALVNKSALTASDDDLSKIWGGYVQQSANYFDTGQTLTPWDILAKDVNSRGAAASLAGTKKQTTSDTSLTSRVDAKAIFQSAAQSLLGRNPTDAEAAAFQKVLNAQESANPTTATITTSNDELGNTTSSNRTSQGGVSAAAAAMLAKDQANKDPEAGAYQATTNYMNVILGMAGVK